MSGAKSVVRIVLLSKSKYRKTMYHISGLLCLPLVIEDKITSSISKRIKIKCRVLEDVGLKGLASLTKQ